MTQPTDPVDTFELLTAHPGDPPNIRALRLAVIGMGLVLLVGLAAVVARIIYLATRPVSSTSVEGVAVAGGQLVAGPTRSPPLAADINLALPAGAKIRSQSLSGKALAVHYEAGGLETILILDLETGRPVSQVRVSAGPK